MGGGQPQAVAVADRAGGQFRRAQAIGVAAAGGALQIVGADPQAGLVVDPDAHLAGVVDLAQVADPGVHGQRPPGAGVEAFALGFAVQIHHGAGGGALDPAQIGAHPGVDRRHAGRAPLGAVAGDAHQPGASVLLEDQRPAAVAPAGVLIGTVHRVSFGGADLSGGETVPVGAALLRRHVIQTSLLQGVGHAAGFGLPPTQRHQGLVRGTGAQRFHLVRLGQVQGFQPGGRGQLKQGQVVVVHAGAVVLVHAHRAHRQPFRGLLMAIQVPEGDIQVAGGVVVHAMRGGEHPARRHQGAAAAGVPVTGAADLDFRHPAARRGDRVPTDDTRRHGVVRAERHAGEKP